MRFTMVFAATILGIGQKPAAPTREEVTCAALRASAVSFENDFIIDLGPPGWKPLSIPPTLNEIGLKSMAAGMPRILDKVEGVEILRMPTPGEPRHPNDVTLDALSRLPNDLLKSLFDTGVCLSDVPDKYRDDVITAVATSPQMAEELATAPDTALVRICVGASARFNGRLSGQSYNLFTANASIPTSLRDAKHAANPVKQAPEKRLAMKGGLEFGAGELLTMKEIVDRASKVFNRTYFIDRRISAEELFAKGTLDQTKFEKVFARLTEVSSLSKGEASPTDMFRLLCNKFLNSYSPSLATPKGPDLNVLLNPRPMNSGAFSQLSDPIAQDLSKALNMDDTDSVTLLPGLMIQVEIGSSTRFGLWIRGYQP